MNNCVLVTLADRRYLFAARQVFNSARLNGKWPGDYLLLAHDIPSNAPGLEWFRKNKIAIRHCIPLDEEPHLKWPPVVLSKLYLFDYFFKQWESVVYLDADVMVRQPIERLAKYRGFYATSVYSREKAFSLDGKKLKNRDLLNSGVMAFSTDVVTESSFSDLIETYRRLDKDYAAKVYPGGLEELVLALWLYGRKKELPLSFNVHLNDLREIYKVQPHQINGRILHFATGPFFLKPWSIASPYNAEWRRNFLGALSRNRKIDRLGFFIMILQIKKARLLNFLDKGTGRLGQLVKRLNILK